MMGIGLCTYESSIVKALPAVMTQVGSRFACKTVTCTCSEESMQKVVVFIRCCFGT